METIYIIGVVLFVKHILYTEWLQINYHWELLENNRKWLFYALKPFGFCSYCTAGQITFWTMVFNSHIIDTIGTTCATIILTAIIEMIWNRLR